tara:strand:- start:713 stop:916 length:204 start_codon:yes stop_codon:yes gene_type:complete
MTIILLIIVIIEYNKLKDMNTYIRKMNNEETALITVSSVIVVVIVAIYIWYGCKPFVGRETICWGFV